MAIVEIRCPRCGSISHVKNEKTHEYFCNHCNTTFVLVDTTKKEIVRDIKRHNCPICGRPIGMAGYVCTGCGMEDLCENCVDEVNHKYVCKNCLKVSGEDCIICGKYGFNKCAVCGRRTCGPCAEYCFEVEGKYNQYDESEGAYTEYPCFSLECPTCNGYVCNNCYVEKSGFLGKKAYYCKKCGSQLTQASPLSEPYWLLEEEEEEEKESE